MRSFFYRVFRNIFRLLNKILNKFGILLSKPDFIHGSPAFNGSLVLSRRMFQTKEFLNAVSNIEGDIVEGGVHWGYGLIIELLLSQKKIHAFDSFQGHSEPTLDDKSSKSWKPLDNSFRVSKDDALKTILLGTNFSYGEINNRINFYEGWIDETMPKWALEMNNSQSKIAYVSADMDIYEPTKIILTQTYPFLNSGAIVVVGIIDNPELAGKTKAFKEFLDLIDQSEIEIKTREIIDTDGKKQNQTYFIRK